MEPADRVRVRDLDAGFRSEYEQFVSDHPARTAFHRLAWKQAIERTFDYEPAYRVVLNAASGEVVGAIPGFGIQRMLASSHRNPFCEYGFPLVAEDTWAEPVLAALAEETNSIGPRIIKDVSFSGVSGYRAAGYGGVDTGVTYRLPLAPGFDRLRETAFDPELRRAVRQATRAGLAFELADGIDGFHRLYQDTMRRLGSPPFPQAFFQALKDTFQEDCRLWMVRDGEPVAGVLALRTNGTCHLLVNGSNRDHFPDRPNHLLYTRVIEQLAGTRTDIVDFGRTDPDSGVADFKDLFGATPVRLASFAHPPDFVGRANVSGLKQLAPMTRLVGPALTHPIVGPRLKELIAE